MQITPKDLDARLQAMEATKYPYLRTWQDIMDYMVPGRGAKVSGVLYTPNARRVTLYDNHAVDAAQLLAQALHGIVTNASSLWLGLRCVDPREREMKKVKEWLSRVERTAHEEIYVSNADTQLAEMYQDFVTIATACMLIEEGDETALNFDTLHISEYFIAENNKGRIDTVFRRFEYSARQAAKEFADEKDKLSKDVKKAIDKEPDKQFTFCHAVFPRDDIDESKVDSTNMPFASVYWEPKAKNVIRESGFREFPYATPRYSVRSGEVWGWSPAFSGLVIAKLLNKIAKTVLDAGERRAKPPLQAPDEGLVSSGVTIVPGEINFYRAGTTDRIEPIIMGDPAFGQELIEFYGKRLWDTFQLSQVQLANQPYMSVQEVLTRSAQSDRIMGPMLGRLRFEFLGPVAKRVFGILSAKGAFPEPPAILKRSGAINVEYISPLARSQRMHEANAISRINEIMAPLWGVDPSSMDVVDGDETVRVLYEVLSGPRDVVRDREQVAEIRKQRKQDQQAAMQAEALQNQARAAKDGASAMKEMQGIENGE